MPNKSPTVELRASRRENPTESYPAPGPGWRRLFVSQLAPDAAHRNAETQPRCPREPAPTPVLRRSSQRGEDQQTPKHARRGGGRYRPGSTKRPPPCRLAKGKPAPLRMRRVSTEPPDRLPP